MNKRIDFSYNGGFPVTQETFEWMQDSYRNAFAGIAGFIGSKVIISGVEVVGNTVTNGWISYNNELLPFVGGQLSGDSTVAIIQTPSSKTFEDNQVRPVYFERIAVLGTGGLFPFTDLVRPGMIRNLWQRGDIKMLSCSMDYLTANFDQTGLGINERIGWAIMNGNNGTENWGGRVPVGYDPNNADYNTLAKPFGAKQIYFDWKNLPVQGSGSVVPGEAGLIKRSFNGEGKTVGSVDEKGSGNEPNIVDPPQRLNLGGEGKPLDIRQEGVVTLYTMKL